MPQTQKRAARANGTALIHTKSKLASSIHTATEALRQDPIDTVALLAARSGVAAATVRAHLAAFGIGGAHG